MVDFKKGSFDLVMFATSFISFSIHSVENMLVLGYIPWLLLASVASITIVVVYLGINNNNLADISAYVALKASLFVLFWLLMILLHVFGFRGYDIGHSFVILSAIILAGFECQIWSDAILEN